MRLVFDWLFHSFSEEVNILSIAILEFSVVDRPKFCSLQTEKL
jgi:hypothetical protein